MNRTKRIIFNTAIKLFSEKGYESTSIEEITAVAGVAKGSLYYHFPTKEDVFDFLLDDASKLLSNSIEIKFRHTICRCVCSVVPDSFATLWTIAC